MEEKEKNPWVAILRNLHSPSIIVITIISSSIIDQYRMLWLHASDWLQGTVAGN